jgi:hypothetical protein
MSTAITANCRDRIIVHILLFAFSLFFQTIVAQGNKSIDLELIPQRKVRRFIESRSIDHMHDFSSIHASWKENIDESDFHVMENTYFLKYKLTDVWECYRHPDTFVMWSGLSFSFGLMISKPSSSVIYANSSCFPDIDTGQVYFLNLRFMKGLFNVPVAFEIITLDQKNHLIEFSYIDNNKSLGKQSIQFFDTGDDCTGILHRSLFKSKSLLRDDFLYPYFHKKFTAEFHRNMNDYITNGLKADHLK